MFIAENKRPLRRRSEEREFDSPFNDQRPPAPPNRRRGRTLVFGYKHVTPAGVKNPRGFTSKSNVLQLE